MLIYSFYKAKPMIVENEDTSESIAELLLDDLIATKNGLIPTESQNIYPIMR